MGELEGGVLPFKHNSKAYTQNSFILKMRGSSVNFCTYQRLEPAKDTDTLQQPLPRVYGAHRMASEANREWATLDFKDRQMALKNKHLKTVVTEESLDDWYAQSLGIKYDRYLKQKKMIQQMVKDARKKKK